MPMPVKLAEWTDHTSKERNTEGIMRVMNENTTIGKFMLLHFKRQVAEY